MATQEIYIRNANETEARGPFNLEQLSSLADAGQVTAETLVYDGGIEQWVALSTRAELMSVAFPEKKKLTLKAKEIQTLNRSDENVKAITVGDMLAAAEGRTDDTKGKSDPEIEMMRAAQIGMWASVAALAIAAAGELLPAASSLSQMTGAKVLAQPLVVLGAIDVVLAVLLGLGMSTLYPLVRFRAALGLGLAGFMFYAQGFDRPLLGIVLGTVGLYGCTVVVTLLPAILAAVAAVVGMGAVTWFFLSP